MNTSVIILVLTCLAAIAAFIANKEDSAQKNWIEQLGKLNEKLSNEIKLLSDINNNIASNAVRIINENKTLTEQNIELSNSTNLLTQEVRELTKTSNLLITKVDRRTENDVAQNATSGRLELEFGKELSADENVTITFGGINFNQKVKDLYNGWTSNRLVVAGSNPIKLQVVNNRLLISFVIYDLRFNWIAEVENNYWRRNPLMIAKFNYDSKGFEVIDNFNFVALSVDIKDRNHIVIQGILPAMDKGIILFLGNKTVNATLTNNMISLAEVKTKIKNQV